MGGCGDTADGLIGWDLVQEFGQYGSIPDVAAGDLPLGRLRCNRLSAMDRPNLQRCLVDAPLGTLQCNALPGTVYVSYARYGVWGRPLLGNTYLHV